MLSVGNENANNIWEARIYNKKKPSPNSGRDEKEKWIRAKYEHKEFLSPVNKVSRDKLLVEAVTNSDVCGVALHLAQGANTNNYNHDLKSPLHIAASNGNLAIVQLLLWVRFFY